MTGVGMAGLFWLCLVMIGVGSLAGWVFLLRGRRKVQRPFHGFWAEFGWGLVPVLILLALLLPAAVKQAGRLALQPVPEPVPTASPFSVEALS
ncbi:hypothetical protein [Motiliproteus sp. SC1-56]|uniref:hypothetical protein n=1 Tax=Motiliproteus sp. SC1-56 TaxID=2799565 RepID=UPI001A8D5D53|nr:hypothetical protein [Motiliproteus sp. SC1-56]